MSSAESTVPIGLCQCGCGERTTVSKKTGKQNRYVHAGHANRAWPGYVVSETGCWEWQGALNAQGYGRCYHPEKKKPVLAHRFYYEREHGPIDAPSLDHLCRNTRCVNPAHLEPCTNQENVRRGTLAKLDWNDIWFIRRSCLSNLELGKRLGVSNSTICNIRKGRAWPEAQAPWNQDG